MSLLNLRGPGRSLLASDRLPREVAEAWLQEPPRPSGEQIERIESTVGPLLVKPDDEGTARRLLARLGGRPTRSRRALRLGARLEDADVPIARPLAAVEEGGRSWLLLEHLPGQDLHGVLLGPLAELDRSKRDGLWHAVADALARLHRAGFRQRDLKAPNVHVLDDPRGPTAPRVALLDLDGVSPTSAPTPEPLAIKDLGRLAASLHAPAARRAGVDAPDWRALLASYLELRSGEPAPFTEIGAWIRRTTELGDATIERNLRLGRPIA